MKALQLSSIHPAAIRRDSGGFCCVAFPDDLGFWSGRSWRLIDWKPFFQCDNLESYNDVFAYFADRIDGYKLLCGK